MTAPGRVSCHTFAVLGSPEREVLRVRQGTAPLCLWGARPAASRDAVSGPQANTTVWEWSLPESQVAEPSQAAVRAAGGVRWPRKAGAHARLHAQPPPQPGLPLTPPLGRTASLSLTLLICEMGQYKCPPVRVQQGTQGPCRKGDQPLVSTPPPPRGH